MDRRRLDRRHSAPRRALRRDAARQDRRFPHGGGPGLRHGGPLPPQGRAAEPGHRAWRPPSPVRCTTGSSRWKPARRSAPTKARCGRSRCKVEGDRLFIALEAAVVKGGMTGMQSEEAREVRTTCPYCGVGCGVLAKDRRGRQPSLSVAIPSIQRISAASAQRGRRSPRPSISTADCFIPKSTGGALAGTRRSTALPRPSSGPSPSMVRMRSPSMSRASC